MKSLAQHLLDRHLDFDLHRPVVDEAERVATFFLYNLSGQLVGYQQYRPDADKTRRNDPKLSRYFTYRALPTVSVWGVESLHLTPNMVFLTEGLFDAARLTQRGFSALAVLSNNPDPQLSNWLFCLGRRVVAVCDNDRAGLELAKFGHEAVFTAGKDLGDSSDEEVTALLSRFS